MGWISDRHMRRGGSIGGRSGKHKGPLRKIIRIVAHAETMFDYDVAELECGHTGRSYGGVRARCAECGKNDPKYSQAKGGE